MVSLMLVDHVLDHVVTLVKFYFSFRLFYLCDFASGYKFVYSIHVVVCWLYVYVCFITFPFLNVVLICEIDWFISLFFSYVCIFALS